MALISSYAMKARPNHPACVTLVYHDVKHLRLLFLHERLEAMPSCVPMGASSTE